MDLLFISRCLPYPLHHGDRLIVHHLALALAARGHRCDAIALAQAHDREAEVRRSAAIFRDLETVRERPRSALAYLRRLARPFPRRATSCWHPDLWRTAERRLAAQRYDVVHFFGGIQVYELRDVARRLPRVIVPYESHALWRERALAGTSGLAERVGHRLALAMARLYERRMFEGFDRVVVLTDEDRRALLRLGPQPPVAVIPNGVDADRSLPRPPSPRSPVLVFVGNYAYPPNVRAACVLASGILPRVRAQVPDASVTLVGADPTPEVLALAGPSVEVTGRVDEVAVHLARGSCFVAPLTMGAGLKNKVLEAMAAGLPVVATPLALEGIAAIPGEHALTGTTPAELAARVLAVLQDPALGERLGAGGRALVERRYTWPLVAERYETLYRDVIASHGGPGA